MVITTQRTIQNTKHYDLASIIAISHLEKLSLMARDNWESVKNLPDSWEEADKEKYPWSFFVRRETSGPLVCNWAGDRYQVRPLGVKDDMPRY